MTDNNQLNRMSDHDIIKALYLSQGLVALLCLCIYFIFIRDVSQFLSLWDVNWLNLIIYGVGSSVVVIILQLVMDDVFPEKWTDDGGINKRMFQALSYPHIVILMAIVAILEELLFRGMIQTQFGLTAASIIFALIHVRYIKKPLLLFTAVVLGFYLGWLFILTNSLLVPMLSHYTIDVVLGIILKKQMDKQGGL